MRELDWVDRLAGVDCLVSFRMDYIGEGNRLTPQGPWLRWSKTRRLVDLVRARVQSHIMFAWFWITRGRDRCYADIAFGLYDIRLQYLFERDVA